MKPLSTAAGGVLADICRRGPASPGKIAFAWKAAVGPALERATAVRLEDHVLVIEAASRQWANEVSRSAPVILGRLQRLLGSDVVTGISVRAAR
jgi:predicted nucleic acid-binding Zn ribbon protein